MYCHTLRNGEVAEGYKFLRIWGKSGVHGVYRPHAPNETENVRPDPSSRPQTLRDLLSGIEDDEIERREAKAKAEIKRAKRLKALSPTNDVAGFDLFEVGRERDTDEEKLVRALDITEQDTHTFRIRCSRQCPVGSNRNQLCIVLPVHRLHEGKTFYQLQFTDRTKKNVGGDGLFVPHMLFDDAGKTLNLVSRLGVFIPEGFSDTKTIVRHGGFAVGRPSNVGGLESLVKLDHMLADMGSNHPFYLVADNDISGPLNPGWMGAYQTALALIHRIQRAVFVLHIPVQYEDVDSWRKQAMDNASISFGICPLMAIAKRDFTSVHHMHFANQTINREISKGFVVRATMRGWFKGFCKAAGLLDESLVVYKG